MCSQVIEVERMNALRALWLAVQEDKPDEVFSLVSKCDSKMPNVDGRTALMYAAVLGRAKCAYHLARADRQAYGLRDKDGRTAMHWAAIGGDCECVHEIVRTLPPDRVEYLLSKDKSGSSCLDIAISMGHGETLDRILSSVFYRLNEILDAINVSNLGPKPIGILATLGRHGFAVQVGKLVAKLDPKERDELRRTPLHVAASVGSAVAVRALLKAGADPRALDSMGRLPVHACAAGAINKGLAEVARILIPLCDTYWVDNDGASALMLAVQAKHPDVAMELLPHSEPGLLDFKGRGVDHRTVEYGDMGFLRIEGGEALLRACRLAAEPSLDALSYQAAKDIHGRNFIQAAENGATDKLLRLLDAEDVRRAKAIREDGEDSMDTKSSILNMIPLAYRVDKDGRTALMAAAQHGRADCVKLLLARGADPIARDRWNLTALMHAAHPLMSEAEEAKTCVKLLIPVSHADARANGGANALEMSIRCKDSDFFDMLSNVSRLDYETHESLLLSAVRAGNAWAVKRFAPKADLSVRDRDGNVAFDLAKSWNPESEKGVLLRSLLGKKPSLEFLGERLMRQIKQYDDFKFLLLIDNHHTLKSKVVKDGSAMIAAASTGHMNYAMALLDHSDASAVDVDGSNILMLAVKSKNTDIKDVRKLMKLVDIDAQDCNGMTAVMHAIGHYKEALAVLLKVSDLSLRDKRGRTLLMFSAREADEIPKVLLTKIDPSAVDSNGKDALMYAARYGQLANVAVLLPVSDPRRADEDGWTALHVAAAQDYEDVVKALLPLSDPDAKAVSGLNVLGLAKRKGASSAAKLLAEGERARKAALKAARPHPRWGTERFDL